jgi:hypothetical protein
VSFVSVAVPDRVNWSFFGAQGARHYFLAVSTGVLLLIEFCESEFNIFLLNEPSNPSPDANRNELFIVSVSAWSVGDEMFALSPMGGKVMSLDILGVSLEGSSDDEDLDLIPVTASAKLWVCSEQASRAIEVLEMHTRRDWTAMLIGQRFTFSPTSLRKVLKIQSTESDQVIVGVRLWVGTLLPPRHPSWVKVNGRHYPIDRARWLCLPLARNEARPRAAVELEFPTVPSDVPLGDLTVFVVKASEIGAQETGEWFSDGLSIFDFEDTKGIKAGELLVRLQEKCTELAEQGKGGLSEEDLSWLVRVMYANPALSIACRRLIVKCFEDLDVGVQVWADTIKVIVQAGEVHNDCWPALWRDAAVLPLEIRGEILSVLWKASPALAGVFPVVAAFICGPPL